MLKALMISLICLVPGAKQAENAHDLIYLFLVFGGQKS